MYSALHAKGKKLHDFLVCLWGKEWEKSGSKRGTEGLVRLTVKAFSSDNAESIHTYLCCHSNLQCPFTKPRWFSTRTGFHFAAKEECLCCGMFAVKDRKSASLLMRTVEFLSFMSLSELIKIIEDWFSLCSLANKWSETTPCMADIQGCNIQTEAMRYSLIQSLQMSL